MCPIQTAIQKQNSIPNKKKSMYHKPSIEYSRLESSWNICLHTSFVVTVSVYCKLIMDCCRLGYFLPYDWLINANQFFMEIWIMALIRFFELKKNLLIKYFKLEQIHALFCLCFVDYNVVILRLLLSCEITV